MDNGYLAKYFKGVASKKLSQVEADALKSNQHEYNGDKGLKGLLGVDVVRKVFDTSFMYLSDEDIVSAEGRMTWYDARENHPARTEWRLYFPANDVTIKALTGDTLYLCKKADDTLLVIIAQSESTFNGQLRWLFDLEDTVNAGFTIKSNFTSDKNQIEYIARIILEQIGIEYENSVGNDYLEDMIDRFNGKFPATKDFSKFARETVKDVSPVEEPDGTLLKWLNQEEVLFRTFEKYIIAERLRKGFIRDNEVDVDEFISFSLSVQNRRKSRVGLAFENHVEYLLTENSVLCSRTKVTENKSKPDFIFPCIEVYRNQSYPAVYLTMLGVKSTCKDRWRQVLAEADRIERKHLLTLEAAISVNQTNEMKVKNVQLVLPKEIHGTYSEEQQGWLYSVEDFIDEVKEKQKYYKEWCCGKPNEEKRGGMPE